MKSRRSTSALSATLFFAAAAALVLLSCDSMESAGTDRWHIAGKVTIMYTNLLPVPSGDLVSYRYRMADGKIVGNNKIYETDFVNGSAQIPAYEFNISYEDGYYVEKVVGIVLADPNYSGRTYGDTAYFQPYLRLAKPKNPYDTLEFTIYVDPPTLKP